MIRQPQTEEEWQAWNAALHQLSLDLYAIAGADPVLVTQIAGIIQNRLSMKERPRRARASFTVVMNGEEKRV